jgi:hypothetical protein
MMAAEGTQEPIMTDMNAETRPMVDPEGRLERAFIDEYLRQHGHEPEDVRAMPEPRARILLEAASIYAAGRLAELQARAHYVHDMHHTD